MDTVLFIIAALTASAPIAAAVLVSIASRREDHEWTLGEPNVSPTLMIARRILDYHTDNHRCPRPRSRATARTPSREPATQPNPGEAPTAPEPRRLLMASR
jgi:hypothetical protein